MEEVSGDKAKIRNRTNEIEDSGSEPNDENGYWAPRKRMRRRSTTLVETERVYRYLPDNMCHQCQKSDKPVERCHNCKRKRYCHPCLNSWYPGLAKEDVAKNAPSVLIFAIADHACV